MSEEGKRAARKLNKAFNKLSRETIKHVQKEYERLNHELLKHFLGQVMKDSEAVRLRRSAAIRAGQARAKERGEKFGGARNVPRFDHKRIVRLARQGHTQNEIAVKLGCSQSLVSRVLRAYVNVKERKR
jgi:hypothetical protein